MKFLRYPGGKSKLITFLSEFIPDNSEIKGKYIEPFIGGGSVFLYVQPNKALVSDLNKELIDLYKGIKNSPHKVWEIFESFPSGKESYYRIRNQSCKEKPLYFRAARTLYLNRTCFKGMWRHNPEGNFNVGYGGEERRWAISHENIVELSKRFKGVTILNSDFESVLNQASDGDFIFLDPPYKPGEKEMFEAHYINGRFPFKEQVRLSNRLKEVSTRNKIRWMMTNSSNSEICALYKGFNIKTIPKGTSNVVGVHKNNLKEVVITNY